MEKAVKKSFTFRMLDRIEAAGNKLPPPTIIFFCLAIGVVVLSLLGNMLGWSATGEVLNSATGTTEQITYTVFNLLSADGIRYMLNNAMSIFITFPTIGPTIIIMFGIGLAQESGYLETLVRSSVAVTPEKLVTPFIIFIGLMTSIADNAGFLILVPLAAMIYKASGKHPIAGIAMAFAGVSAGIVSHLIIGNIDVIITGLTQAAVASVNPDYEVTQVANIYFLVASCAITILVVTLVDKKMISPRLGAYDASIGDGSDPVEKKEISSKMKQAMKAANIILLVLIVGLVALCIPQNSIMRNPETGDLIAGSTLMGAIVPILTIIISIPSIVYGYRSGTFKDSRDVVDALTKGMASISNFMVTMFFAAQFIEYFGKSNMGRILSLSGAAFLKTLNMPPIILVILFILICCLCNILMCSASAKWAIFAPVFVPMLMQLNISPELTQLAYRIGDGSTNIISPAFPFLAFMLATMKKYDKNSGFGTLISCMMPYAVATLVAWIIMLAIWMMIDLPLGPGALCLLR